MSAVSFADKPCWEYAEWKQTPADGWKLGWYAMEPRVQEELEGHFQADPNTKVRLTPTTKAVGCTGNHVVWKFNLETMQQVRIQDSVKVCGRNIRRVLVRALAEAMS